MSHEKVWFITGASRGFGRIWTEAALERGDKVAAAARNPAALAGLTEKYGSEVLPLELDVTKTADAAHAVKAAHERFGRLDVVENNAGYGYMGAVEERRAHHETHWLLDCHGSLSASDGRLGHSRASLRRARFDRGDDHAVAALALGRRSSRPAVSKGISHPRHDRLTGAPSFREPLLPTCTHRSPIFSQRDSRHTDRLVRSPERFICFTEWAGR